MEKIERMDRVIFLCLCGYALFSCISNALAENLTLLGVIIGIIRCIKEPKNFLSIEFAKPYIRGIYIFFIFLFLLIFTSPEIMISANEYWNHFRRLGPFILGMFFVSNRKQVLWLAGLLFLSLMINNIFAIYNQLNLLFNTGGWGRTFGFEKNIIVLAGLLLITIPSLFILILSNKTKKLFKYLLSFCLVISLVTLLMNGTRAAWFITIFFMMIIPFIVVKSKRNLFFLISIIMLFIIGIGVSTSTINQRIISSFDMQHTSNKGHYLVVRDSLEMIKDNPLIGVGIGRFKTVLNQSYASPELSEISRGKYNHAHNNIIFILAETGLIGGIAFCYMFGSLFFYSWKKWKNDKDIIALIFFFATLAITLQGILETSFRLHIVIKIYYFLLLLYIKYHIYSYDGLNITYENKSRM